VHRPTALIGFSPAALGLTLFVVANFAYQAALIYYDATLKVVSLPSTRGTLSGIGVAVGYMGTVFVGLLIFLAEIPVADRFLLSAVLFGLFAVPIFAVVREPRSADAQPINDMIITDSRTRDVVRPVFLTFDRSADEGDPFAHMVMNASMVDALHRAAVDSGTVVVAPPSATIETRSSSALDAFERWAK